MGLGPRLAHQFGLAQLPASLPDGAAVKVERVVDGDTVVIRLDGRSVKVRLIGVDTPETVDPRRPVQRFGHEASDFLRRLVEGRTVRVEHEPAGVRQDRYGRELLYLFREPDGLFVNREIVARGYGHALTKYPFRFADDFRAAERQAREQQLGLWGPNPAPTATPETEVFLTRSGKRYHRAGCRTLARGSIPMPLGEAAKRYKPCSICDPPALPR
jgi:micrococcal nuclease